MTAPVGCLAAQMSTAEPINWYTQISAERVECSIQARLSKTLRSAMHFDIVFVFFTFKCSLVYSAPGLFGENLVYAAEILVYSARTSSIRLDLNGIALKGTLNSPGPLNSP